MAAKKKAAEKEVEQVEEASQTIAQSDDLYASEAAITQRMASR